MDRIDRTVSEFRSMEEEARGEGLLQSLHPLTKLLVSVIYLVILLSFHKYNLSRVLLMGVYPILLFSLCRIPVRPMWGRMWAILVPVFFVGIANPFFDKVPVSPETPFLTGGMVSMVTLLLKGLFAVAAVYVLMVTTPMDDLCRALRKLKVPSILVTVIHLVYRYLGVFLEEVGKMRTAYSLRAPGQKGINIKVWGPMVGMLLLRSIDRADAVYQSMTLRGFSGEFLHGRDRAFGRDDILFILLCLSVLLLIRVL